jgi:hypothetical protein
MKTPVSRALGLVLLLVPHYAMAQTGRPPAAPSIRAIRAAEAIVLDGLLTEGSWSKAEPATRFLQQDPEEGAPATEPTEVRVLYDTRRMYIGVLCRDADPSGLRATELRRDNQLENDDIFEIVLDTFHDHRSGYLFRINPLGTQYDATFTGEGQTVNSNWDEKWDVKTRVTEEGWSAEISIPFKSLRFLSGSNTTWGVNFHRTIKRNNEDVFWTAHNRSYEFMEVSRAGTLVGLSDIQGFTARLKPYFTTGASKALVRGQPETGHLTDVGIEDAKFMITPQLALDLTVNPDFAQADVDSAQTNLTRFDLFFPEKREFFQEGSGIFQFGTGEPFGRPQVLLLHTRRIGLSSNREEVPIRGGLKLTGKQGPFDIGLLNMQTGDSAQLPGQNFTALRVKGNLLARSYVGAMFTRNTAGLSGQANQAGGIDASFSFFEHLSLRGFLAENDAPNTGARQWAGQARGTWETDRFDFLVEHVNIQENFQPKSGFVSRAEPNWQGVKRSVAEASYSPRPNLAWVRQFELSSSFDFITNQQNVLDTRTGELGLGTEFQSGDALDFEFSREFERLLRPLRIRGGGTVPSGDYSANKFSWMYRAFRGRPVSGNLSVDTGDFYGGRQNSINLSPQFKLSPNLSVDPGYRWTQASLPGTPSFILHQLNGTINYSLTQRWLTRTTVLYNSQDDQVAVNFRLNYIYRPGDDIFLVLNETRTSGTNGGLQNRALILKTTYSFDF